MSEASESAHVRIFLADYAIVDPLGKITVVGGGISILGFNPASGTTAPFSVVAIASFDPKCIGDSPAVELLLENDEGQLVHLPGQPGPLRVGTSEKLNPPALPGANIPNDAVRPKAQILMQFQNGLPLPPGNGFRWRVRVDHESRPEWAEPLYVPTASAGPVIF
ncbi:hypothetical protein [Mycobacterium intracellulare]|uniref:hypothetical protein n=1 Tax=Mycobacterium intracellulare TaxID=1767 RepID=UPI001140BC2E|nr:hypothetical protein [Mycobacterium intracellulare]